MTYESELGTQEFMHTPKDQDRFNAFVSEHEEEISSLRGLLTQQCPDNKIYSGVLEP